MSNSVLAIPHPQQTRQEVEQEIVSSLTEVDSELSIPEKKAGETFSPAHHLSLEDTTQIRGLL